MAVLASQIIVLAIGVTVVGLSAWGMFAPAKLISLVTSAMDKSWGIYVAVIVRLLLGAGLIIAAPISRFPVAFQVLGVIAVLAAVGVVVMGRERIRRLLVWWPAKFSRAMTRLWLLFGIAFGGFLVYGVI